MKRETYTIEGTEYRNLREVTNAYGCCSYSTLVKRLNKGMPIYDAIYSDRWTPDCIPFQEKVYTSVEELARSTGKNPVTISNRLENGWLVWTAVTTPPGYVIDGKEFTTLNEVATYYKMNYHTLHTRIWRDKMRLYDAVYHGKPVVWEGVAYSSRKEMCAKLEIPYNVLNMQLYQGKKLAGVVHSLLLRKREKQLRRKQRLRLVFMDLVQAYHYRIEAGFACNDDDVTEDLPATYKAYKRQYTIDCYE